MEKNTLEQVGCLFLSYAMSSVKQVTQNDEKILSGDQAWGTGTKRKRRLWEN